MSFGAKTEQESLRLAIQQHRAGRLAEAQRLYREVLARQPRSVDALAMLGHALRTEGKLQESQTAYRQALELRPDMVDVLQGLAMVQQALGKPQDALETCRRATPLKMAQAESYNLMGNILHGLGRDDEALDAFRMAIQLRPQLGTAHYNLGIILAARGQLDEAVKLYRKATDLEPNLADAHNNLAHLLCHLGMFSESAASCRRAIALRPEWADPYCNLAEALRELGMMQEAAAAAHKALQLRPTLPEAYIALGFIYRDCGDAGRASEAFAKAAELRPQYALAHMNLGNSLRAQGRITEAIVQYRKAMELQPDWAAVQSNLIYAMQFDPAYDAQALRQEQRSWNQQHALPLRSPANRHSNDRTPDRSLRIAYISPDFRNHCQSVFTVPLLSRHDHHQFHITCYADLLKGDNLTEQIKGYSDQWRDIAAMPDQDVAELITADQIDILVDLTMHMAQNRLLVLARKPAPVQVSWLAYPGSTGLETIDYRLTDPHLDPPGTGDDLYSEKSIRLPDTFWCYDPLATEPAVNALPASSNGFVTFGSLNNFCKANDAVLRLWAQVLKAVEGSQLLLLAPQGTHRQHALEVLEREGITPSRIEFAAPRPRPRYLELYHRIDLGLDTLPYNGHTTSLDSFWMGVPVVTLVGATVVGRAGLSQLMNLNLPELIAHDPRQFVQIATELAVDLPRLTSLRATLRQRMEQSPLMDAPRFTRNIESAYHIMWRKWCEKTR